MNPFAFFNDLYARLLIKNPKFFDVIQVIALIVGAIAGAPVFLKTLGIAIPEIIPEPYNIIITVASAVGIFIAQLPNAEKK